MDGFPHVLRDRRCLFTCLGRSVAEFRGHVGCRCWVFAVALLAAGVSGCGSESASSLSAVPHLEGLGARFRNQDGQVTAVTLLNRSVDDAAFARLSEIDTLTEIVVQECDQLTGSSLADVANLPNLTTLKILLTAVGDEGLAHLSAAKNLEVLALVDVPVTDQGLKFLRDLPKLRELRLEKLSVTDAGLEHLQKLAVLKSLSLSGCQKVNGSGLATLTPLADLTEIDITHTGIIPNGAHHLQHIPQVKQLRFDTESFTDKCAESLPHLVNLEKLVLLRAPITNKAIPAIARLAALRTLEMPYCENLTCGGLEPLSAHSQLEWIDIQECPEISDECVHVLSKIKSLQRIVVNDTRVTTAGAKALKEALPNCVIEFGRAPNTNLL